MRKKLLLALSILVAIAAFIYIGGTIGGDYLTVRPVVENEKIHIGVFEPLSGYLSDGGKQEALGLEYARSMRPTVKVGGVTYDIELVVVDNESETKTAEQAAQKLVNSGVSAVLGSYGCAMSAAGEGIFIAAGIPALGISCTDPRLAADYSLYYRLCYSDAFQGSVLANFAYGLGFRSVAVATQAADSYSKGLGAYFSEQFEKHGGVVYSFSFNNVQMNFEDLIGEIADSRADCVFIPSAVSTGVIFVTQARQAGLMLPVIGADKWDTQALITGLGENAGEIYLVSPFAAEDTANAKGGDFAAKFSVWVSKTGERLEQNGGGSYAAPVTALAYDAYKILCDAIETADSFDPAAIAAQLALTNYTGATGKISFTGADEQKTAYIKTIDSENGSFTLLKTYYGN